MVLVWSRKQHGVVLVDDRREGARRMLHDRQRELREAALLAVGAAATLTSLASFMDPASAELVNHDLHTIAYDSIQYHTVAYGGNSNSNSNNSHLFQSLCCAILVMESLLCNLCGAIFVPI